MSWPVGVTVGMPRTLVVTMPVGFLYSALFFVVLVMASFPTLGAGIITQKYAQNGHNGYDQKLLFHTNCFLLLVNDFVFLRMETFQTINGCK
jgi:hypothetical protein